MPMSILIFFSMARSHSILHKEYTENPTGSKKLIFHEYTHYAFVDQNFCGFLFAKYRPFCKRKQCFSKMLSLNLVDSEETQWKTNKIKILLSAA